MINVQGLTQTKVIEIEKLMSVSDVICLTETHEKVRKVKISDNIEVLESMREKEDKKGGGIMVMYRQNRNIMLEKQENNMKDYLFLKGSIYGMEVNMVIVYFATNDKERNKKLKKEIGDIIENNVEGNLIVMGDFNGHVGFKGMQSLDENGKMILEWMELNDDFECKGETTWKRQEQESVIDYVLVSQNLYKEYIQMEIDEQQKYYDLSDHNLIMVELRKKVTGTKDKRGKRWEEQEYYKTDKNSLELYTREVSKKLENKENSDITELNSILQRAANKILKKKYKREVRIMGSERNKEQPWITEDIKQSITKRKEYNRAKRNAKTPQEKSFYYEKYLEEKAETQRKVKKAVYEHEEKVTKEIKDNIDRKKIWEHINKLRKKTKDNKGVLKIYDDERVEISMERMEGVIKEYWKNIYEMNENSIEEVWNMETKEEYKRARGENEVGESNIRIQVGVQEELIKCTEGVLEHLDAAYAIKRVTKNMEDIYIGKGEVKENLRKLKEKKAAGPDGMKAELYKTLQNNEKFTELLAKCFNKVIEEGRVPVSWKESRTVMVPKKNKPKVTELRPIAMTNVSYKLFMSVVVKNPIEKHIISNKVMKENQSGFTEKGRLENNLIILKYCIDKSFRDKKTLYVTTVDFSKAFDSIKRDNLIRVLMDYRIYPKLINIITDIYAGDTTLQGQNEQP